jgi:hypothetical protein
MERIRFLVQMQGLKIKEYIPALKAGFKVRIKLEDKTNAGTKYRVKKITFTKTNA